MNLAPAIVAQLGLPAPGETIVGTDIPWAAISPELILFGAGILVLLLDTAGRERMQAAFSVLAVALAGAAGAAYLNAGKPDITARVVIPVLVALAGLLQFALTALWRDRPRTLGAILTALGFAAALGATAWQWIVAGDAGVALLAVDGTPGQPLAATQNLLGGMFAADGVALFTRFTVCIAGLVTVPLGFAYAESRRIHRGEYYPLLLFAATGMTLLAAAADLLMVFIGIEVLSLSLYILSGFARRDLTSQESALKYFLLGAFSSAILLYGVALAYGVAGDTNIAAVGRAFASAEGSEGLKLAAMALLLVGLAFKTSLVPFHMWTPDVYQGAPTPVVGFMAGGTKAAAFAAFLRLFVGAFAPLQWAWTPVVGGLAIVTMLLGAVLAVVQTDIKRMLGYSAVAHGGYVLVGLVSVAQPGAAGDVARAGTSATLSYLLIYALMSLGSFGVLTLLERQQRKAVSLSDLRGLGRRQPVAAGLFALFLLSLAGIPGTAGFWAKFGVFRAATAPGVDQVVLAVVLAVSSLIAAFFYIRVIITMFVEEAPATDEEAAEVAPAPATGVGATVGTTVGLVGAAAAIVLLGLVPGGVVDLAAQAASYAR